MNGLCRTVIIESTEEQTQCNYHKEEYAFIYAISPLILRKAVREKLTALEVLDQVFFVMHKTPMLLHIEVPCRDKMVEWLQERMDRIDCPPFKDLLTWATIQSGFEETGKPREAYHCQFCRHEIEEILSGLPSRFDFKIRN